MPRNEYAVKHGYVIVQIYWQKWHGWHEWVPKNVDVIGQWNMISSAIVSERLMGTKKIALDLSGHNINLCRTSRARPKLKVCAFIILNILWYTSVSSGTTGWETSKCLGLLFIGLPCIAVSSAIAYTQTFTVYLDLWPIHRCRHRNE